MKHFSFIIFLFCITVMITGCQTGDVALTYTGSSGRVQYSDQLTMLNGMTSDTTNLLGNYLLAEKLKHNPENFIPTLEQLLSDDREQEVRIALVETALLLGNNVSGNPDKAAGYYLTVLFHAQNYLAHLVNKSSPDLFDPDVQVALRAYNLALTELFHYLKKRGLHTANAFELTAAGGQIIRFAPPEFNLPVKSNQITDFLLCADYRTQNLTHNSRRFGLGVQLICDIHEDAVPETVFAEEQVIPATLVMKITPDADGAQRFSAQFYYLDSRSIDQVPVKNLQLPLAQDFSTPLAYMVRNPPAVHFLKRAFLIDLNSRTAGLYHLEPHHDGRIPVVLVHGLMSDIRTWMQMLNTLLSDPVLRKHYRFMGYTYSSGSPIFFSASHLRESLHNEREKLRRDGRDLKNFDRMVVVGHSMGGLLSRLLISESSEKQLQEIIGKEKLDKICSGSDNKIKKLIYFKPFPSVKRVIFIAVPHRGAALADSWLGKWAASLVRLPKAMLDLKRFAAGLFKSDTEMAKIQMFTGIDNLSPENLTLKLMAKMPMSADVPKHSIVGNRSGGDIPGGSDGVVEYRSSHLDGVSSEKVVKSGHSVQQNPLAIQELRRILLEHLKTFPDINMEIEK